MKHPVIRICLLLSLVLANPVVAFVTGSLREPFAHPIIGTEASVPAPKEAKESKIALMSNAHPVVSSTFADEAEGTRGVRRLTIADLSVLWIVAEDDDPVDYKGRLPYVKISELAAKAKDAARLGIECAKLFNFQNSKTHYGENGLKDGNLMTRAIRIIKETAPELKVMPECCACAYTSTGECVITTPEGELDDDATHDYVGKMAVLQANAGADVIVAGLTHRGSVNAIREALDEHGFQDVGIMASIQFQSKFYGPYRKMMRTEPVAGQTFRSHIQPGNWEQTIGWVREFDESCSEFTLQPVMSNTDSFAKIRAQTNKPMTAYSVSTELNLVCDDSALVWNDKNAQILREYYESLLRLGANKIMSYVALEMGQWLLAQEKAEEADYSE